jgi:hypothetical protein
VQADEAAIFGLALGTTGSDLNDLRQGKFAKTLHHIHRNSLSLAEKEERRMKPITAKSSAHEIIGLGTVMVKPITIGMHAEADELASEATEDARPFVFAHSILAAIIDSPPMTPDQIAELSPEATEALVLVAADISEIRNEYDRTSPGLSATERLYQTFKLKERELSKALTGMLKGVCDRMSEGAATALGLYNGIGGQVLEQARVLDRGLDMQKYMIPYGGAAALPFLQEKFTALGDLRKILSSQQSSLDLASGAIREASRIHLPYLSALSPFIDLREPLLSDSLIASGLNAPFMHRPNFVLPTIGPVQDKEELRVRAAETRRRRPTDAYDILWNLEHTIRTQIEDGLRGLHGDQWWKRGIPDNIRRLCEERKQMKEKLGEAEYAPLEYAYFDDYRAIITKGDSWKNAFGGIFGDKAEFEVCMKWVASVRDPIAHCRHIRDEDYNAFVVAANRLLSAPQRSNRLSP